MKKIVASIFLLSLLASCYQPKTHGKFISADKDVWIDGYAIQFEEHKAADKGLVFCQANVQDGGGAKPTCYPAKFK